jgi:Bacillus haemolytic enterotoxin (HBL)
MQDTSTAVPSISPVITTDDLNGVFSSAKTVTNYSQAIITAVPDIQTDEDWATQIKSDVNSSKSNATNWISNICPSISLEIPNNIIDFNNQFQSSYLTISNCLNQINSQPNSIPTAEQKKTVNQQFTLMCATLNSFNAATNTLLDDISEFSTSLNNEQNQLAKDLDTVTNKFLNGAQYIRELSAILNVNFLNCQELGPCSSIVMIDFNINLKVVDTGADPDLISIVYTKTILERQINNVQQAQKSAQLVLDSWTILNTKLSQVIADLNQVSDDEYCPFIAQLDLNTAQQQWQQLSNFAQTFQNNL